MENIKWGEDLKNPLFTDHNRNVLTLSKKKETGIKEIKLGNKLLIEAVV